MSLDLSSAFDTIDHTILINRLSTSFGVSGRTLNWITSYLSNRSQFVKVDNLSSPPQTCLFGVPQGSVLGPLLFTIYVSPIASLLHQLGVNLINMQMTPSFTSPYLNLKQLLTCNCSKLPC